MPPEQIDALRVPAAPPKEKDRRWFDDTRTAYAEPIPRDALAQIVRDALDRRIDPDSYRVVFDYERRICERLSEMLNPLLLEERGDDGEGEETS